MKYKELIKLGFKRFEMNDSVFFDQHGYNAFYMHLKIGNLTFEWWPEKPEQMQLVRYIEHDVHNRLNFTDIETVKMLIDFLTKKYDKSKPVSVYHQAC